MTDPLEPAAAGAAAPAPPALAEDTRIDAPARNQWWDVWDQFKTHKGAVFGACFFIFTKVLVIDLP